MKFNLDYIPTKPNFSITHNDKLFFIGSCFSDEIGFNFKENPSNHCHKHGVAPRNETR